MSKLLPRSFLATIASAFASLLVLFICGGTAASLGGHSTIATLLDVAGIGFALFFLLSYTFRKNVI